MVLAVCHPIFTAALRFPSHGTPNKVFTGKCDTDVGFCSSASALSCQ